MGRKSKSKSKKNQLQQLSIRSFLVNMPKHPRLIISKRFIDLNNDIWINILSYLPNASLLSAALSCKKISSLISDPSFFYWRKSYSFIEKQKKIYEIQYRQSINSYMQSNGIFRLNDVVGRGMVTPEFFYIPPDRFNEKSFNSVMDVIQFVDGLVKFHDDAIPSIQVIRKCILGIGGKCYLKCFDDLLQYLSQTSPDKSKEMPAPRTRAQKRLAESLMKQSKKAKLIGIPKTIQGLFALVIISMIGSHEMIPFIKIILANSDISFYEFTEMTYCILSILNYSPRSFQFESSNSLVRLSYELNFAIDFFHSYDIPRAPLTEEQRQIANIHLEPGQLALVLAYAGTGKTTTCIELAKRNPFSQFLYIAFNKAIQTEASHKFPPNTICMTMHSIAYRYVFGYMGYEKSKLEPGDISNQIVSSHFKASSAVATFIIQTLKRFLWSSRQQMTVEDVPYKAKLHMEREKVKQSQRFRVPWAPQAKKKSPANDNVEKWYATPEEYVNMAKQVWEFMLDPTNYQWKLFGDAYIKLMTLHNYILTDYDYILLDEAQDVSPAMLQFIRAQTCRKILVGDVHQRIYAWRGATPRLLLESQPDYIFRLTRSFRFGQAVANVANIILNKVKGEKVPLLGNGSIKSLVSLVDKKEEFDGKQIAILHRSNRALLSSAVEIASSNINTFSVPGGASGVNAMKSMLKSLIDYDLFYRGQSVYRFRNYANWEEYTQEMKDTENLQALGLIEFVEAQYKNVASQESDANSCSVDMPALVNQISAKLVNNIHDADVLLATVHKAKGLEFPIVKLCDDFMEIHDDIILTGTMCDRSIHVTESMNILYVAVTRAIDKLILSRSLARTIEKIIGKPRRLLISSSCSSKYDLDVQCKDCPITIPFQIQLNHDDPTSIQKQCFSHGINLGPQSHLTEEGNQSEHTAPIEMEGSDIVLSWFKESLMDQEKV